MPSVWNTRSQNEVTATQLALDTLGAHQWAAPLLADIRGHGGVGRASDGLLFEARFALALRDLGLEPQYEMRTVGGSSVDFAFGVWNVELLSLGETRAAGRATWTSGQMFGRTLESPRPIEEGEASLPEEERRRLRHAREESSEGEILQTIDRIVDKAVTGSGRPHKFKEPDGRTLSVLIVDLRTFGVGKADIWDLRQIIGGNSAVPEEAQLYWPIGPSREVPTRGVFDPLNHARGAEHFRSRVHFVGLVTELTYERDELQYAINLFHNPHLIQDRALAEALKLRFPLYDPSKERRRRPEEFLREHFVVTADSVQNAVVVDGRTGIYRIHRDSLEDLEQTSIHSKSDMESIFGKHQSRLDRLVVSKFRAGEFNSSGIVLLFPKDVRDIVRRVTTKA